MSLGDHDRGRGVSDSLTLGYKRAIRSTCWLVSEFEDEEEGLLPAAMLFFFASRDSLRHLGPQGNLGLQLLEGHPVMRHTFPVRILKSSPVNYSLRVTLPFVFYKGKKDICIVYGVFLAHCQMFDKLLLGRRHQFSYD